MDEPGNAARTYSIGELARAAGLSVHALRWYEAEGLFPREVPRTPGGRRIYPEDTVAWLALLGRLRQSGAPITVLREYTALVRAGSGNEAERLALLRAHERSLDAQIAQLVESRRVIGEKATAYQRVLVDRGIELPAG